MVLNVCSEWCKVRLNASGPQARPWRPKRGGWGCFGGWDSLARGGNSRSSPWVPFVSLACRPGFAPDSYLGVCATPQGCCHLLTETKRADANQGLLSTSSTCETHGVLRRLGPATQLFQHVTDGFYVMRFVRTGQPGAPYESCKWFNDALIKVYFLKQERKEMCVYLFRE